MKAYTTRLHYAIAVAMLLLAAAAAGAQDTSAEVSSSRTPGWSFTPGLSVGGVYDSNVALAAVSPTEQKPQSDRLVLAEPFVHLDFLAKRTEFSAGYQGYLRRYMDLDQLNGFDQHSHASLRRLVSKHVTLSLSDSYARVPTTDEIDVAGVPFSRTGSRRNAMNGQLHARLTKFMDLSVKYDNTWVSFDRTDSIMTGGVVNGLTTGLSRRVRPQLSIGAEYAVRFADLNEGTHQLAFHDAGATAQIGLSERTSASFGAGYSYLDDRSLHETRTGPYLRAELTHGTEHATVGAAFEQMFVPSFGFGGSSQSQQMRGYIRMPLNRNRMYLQGTGSWRRTDPFLAGELPLNTTLVRSTLGYSATRYLRIEAFHVFTRQNSQVPGGLVNRQRVGAQIVISQPMRIQ